MRYSSFSRRRFDTGFSLVELMVGLAIGMLAVIVMMQVFSLSENFKRQTTGGDDAQNDGAVALYALQRDMQSSGLGISNVQLLGCNVTLPSGVILNAISPVTINHARIPAGDPGSDTLLIIYGTANGASEGEIILAQNPQSTYTVSTAAPSATASAAYAQNDWLIAEPQVRPSPSCDLTVERVASVAGTTVTVPLGTPSVNNGALYNLGRLPKVLAYAVRSGNLTVCDFTANDCRVAGNVGNTAIWVPIGSNIVSLRAEYGRGTAALPSTGNIPVDTWDRTTPTTNCGWARISAVRFAVVSRSSTYDKGDGTNDRFATTAAPVWAGSVGSPIDLSVTDPDWQHYRYKAFQTYVPLRNMAWQDVAQIKTAGCP